MDSLPYEVCFFILQKLNREDLLAFSLISQNYLQIAEPILAGYRLLGALIVNENLLPIFESSHAVPHLDMSVRHKEKSIIYFAIARNHTRIVEWLVAKYPHLLQTKDDRKQTPLMHAVFQREYTYMEHFITNGACINDQDDTGSTALHYAAGYGSIVMVRCLLNANANFSLQNENGFTPLLLAMRANHEGVAIELIARGADVGTCNQEHDALFWAAFHKNVNLMRHLLDNGADPQAFVCISGDTLLHRAIFFGCNVVQELASRGANIYAHNNDGDTPLLVAQRYGSQSVVAFLETKLAS